MQRYPLPAYVSIVDIINEFILQAAASPWLYLVMFATALIDGFFPPIPSETVLVAAAAVAMSTGETNMLLLILVAAVGAIIGDNLAYTFGRVVGINRFKWMRRPRVTTAFNRAEKALSRNGVALILGARYIPVGRVAVNISAGALRYPRRRFMAVSTVAGLSWALYSTAIGMLAGHWLSEQPLLSAVAGIVFAVVLGFIIDRLTTLIRRRRTRALTPEPEPASEPARSYVR